MKNIYKGNMRNLVIKNLEINDGKVRVLEYDKPIVKKDLLFYVGFMGSYISFDYGTRLPDEYEALDYIKSVIEGREDQSAPYPECVFVNNEDIHFSHEICNENFRSVKKFYKKLLREESKAKKRSI